jgi:hypothetical protein
MSLEKFSSQADPTILVGLKDIAKQEGKQFQALVNEAFSDLLEKRKQGKARPHILALKVRPHVLALLEKRKQGKVRPHVLALLETSMERYDDVYKHLAQ